MEAIGRLAGGIAHDFNNLLTVISATASCCWSAWTRPIRCAAQLRRSPKAAERAAALTRQLLAFSRKQMLAPKVLDLNDVVADIEKMLRRLIGEDIELVDDRRRGLGAVKADPGQIEQVHHESGRERARRDAAGRQADHRDRERRRSTTSTPRLHLATSSRART